MERSGLTTTAYRVLQAMEPKWIAGVALVTLSSIGARARGRIIAVETFG